MQRLSSWLEQLPLPRRSTTRNNERRGKASRSAAPVLRWDTVEEGSSRRYPPPPGHPPPVPDKIDAPMSQSLLYDDLWEPRLSRGSAKDQRSTFLNQDTPMGGSLSQAASRRTIRTNPWISRSSMRASSHHSTTRLPLTSSMTLSSSSGQSSLSPSSSTSSPYVESSSSRLNIKSLDESMCSSGYGSQDSSPASSVHSPNWQQTREDKAVECRSIDLDAELGYLEETSSFGPYDDMHSDDEAEEHVYHELESLNRFSRVLEESRGPSSLSSGSVSLPRPQKANLPTASPVYARPFEGPSSARKVEINHREYVMPGSLPNSYYTSAFSPIPRGDVVPVRRPRQLPLAPPPAVPTAHHYYRRPTPKFIAPPPPPFDEAGYDTLASVGGAVSSSAVWVQAPQAPATTTPMPHGEAQLRKIEQDFLAELDAQIQELQIKSEAVRCLVDEARVRRATTAEWRRARWHNTFELCL